MRIYLLDGLSRYDVFRVWMERLRGVLQVMGHEAVPSPPLRRLEGPAPVVSLGFSMVRSWAAQNRDQYHICWTVDHPGYLANLFMPEVSGFPVNPARTLVLSVDRGWARFAARVYGHSGVVFVPHPGVEDVGAGMEWRERDLPVLVCGSIEDPDAVVQEMRAAVPPLRTVADALLEYRFDAGEPLDAAVWGAVRPLCKDRFAAAVAFNALYTFQDRYHRNRSRLTMLKALKHVPVLCCGVGPWAKLGLPPNVEVRNSLGYDETAALMRRARVVVNCAPLHREGSHERVFEALAAGCGVVSTPSTYLAEQEWPALRFCSADGGDVADVVTGMLSDDTMPDRIAVSRQQVMEKHSMHVRARTVLDAVAKRWPELRVAVSGA